MKIALTDVASRPGTRRRETYVRNFARQLLRGRPRSPRLRRDIARCARKRDPSGITFPSALPHAAGLCLGAAHARPAAEGAVRRHPRLRQKRATWTSIGPAAASAGRCWSTRRRGDGSPSRRAGCASGAGRRLAASAAPAAGGTTVRAGRRARNHRRLKLVRSEIIRYYHCEPERITVIHNGADLRGSRPTSAREVPEAGAAGTRTAEQRDHDPARRQQLQAQRRAAADPRVALAAADGRGVPAWWCVGRGRRAPCERLARKLGVGDLVHFAGSTDQPEKFYAAADIFCLPSYYDPCANALLEALACGLPAVTSTTNGSGELLTGQGRLRRPVRRRAATGAAHRRVLQSRPPRGRIGRRARPGRGPLGRAQFRGGDEGVREGARAKGRGSRALSARKPRRNSPLNSPLKIASLGEPGSVVAANLTRIGRDGVRTSRFSARCKASAGRGVVEAVAHLLELAAELADFVADFLALHAGNRT